MDKISRFTHFVIHEAGKSPARFGYDREMPLILRAARNDNGPIDVLDAGCGNGQYSAWFLNDRYVGVDPGLCQNEIVVSTTRRFIKGTMQELPFADKTFDFVLCSLALEHIQDVREALTSLRRVLRPGGVLVLTTTTKYARIIGEMQHLFWKIEDEHQGQAHHYFETKDLIDEHLASGFATVQVRFIGGPLELALESLYTFYTYAKMRVTGQMYQHGRDSITVSAGTNMNQPSVVAWTWRRVAKAILSLPKFFGNLLSWWIDRRLGVSMAKVVCIVARP